MKGEKRMKTFLMAGLVVTFIFALSCSESGREIDAEKLQKRGDGIYYAINEEEPYSGKVVEFYDRGRKKSEQTFKNGKFHGLTTTWDFHGQKKSEVGYENGMKSGPYRIWYGKGQLEVEGTYKDGKEDGKWVFWYFGGQRLFGYVNRQKQKECNYKNGMLDGQWVSWYENGQKEKEGAYKNGKEDGNWTFWYVNKQKQRECNYQEGVPDGQWVSWYENGQQEKEGSYKDGKEHGKWVFWYTNGQKQRECNYREGLPDGQWVSWYDNGQKQREGIYDHGNPQGSWDVWTEDGWKLDLVKDIDGNSYQTIMIGAQVWMVENLKVTRYRNGDPIPHVTDNNQWSNRASGAYCNYNNNASNAATYGRLYNWYAVNDARGLAPAGWRVPTDTDWQKLIDYLGGSSVAGGKLKETGTAHWNSPNTGATNKSGFKALPGGMRYGYAGNFFSIGGEGLWWSAREGSSSHAWSRRLSYDNSGISRYDGYFGSKQNAFSVRCIRD